MSKCGKCGFEGNIGEHTVLRCRTKDIPKAIYDRACVWMANEENPEDFQEMFLEDVEDITSDSLRQQKMEEMAEIHQTEEAMDIMYEIQNIYNGEEYK